MIIESPEKADSLSFYRKLNFNISDNSDMHSVSDGKIVIRLNPEISEPGIMVFRKNSRETIQKLSPLIKVVPGEEGFSFLDPSGVKVVLVESIEEYRAPGGDSVSLAGNFAGISLGLSDPSLSIKIWELLGFKIVAGSPQDGWAALSDENGNTLSILKREMCPHKFFNPSLSYFNGKENLRIIDNIRKTGVKIEEEITVFNDNGIVDNIIIRDPGGLGFFIFSD